MNIQTVVDNLRKTIAGKEKMLESLHPNNPYHIEYMDDGDTAARRTTIEFLKINIDELKRILQDVELCVEEFEVLKDDLKETNGRVRQLERQASDDSWITNPDRMGGGWTQDELDPIRGWK